MLRVDKLDKSLSLLVKYTLTPLSAPCESLAQRPVCCQDKECKQELPFTSSRQCIGTMDTRLYSAECKDSGQWITNQCCWQSENSVHANIVWLTLVCAQLLLLCMNTYCLWVGQRPEPVVVLLSCCIPQAQVYWFPINHHVGWVVVEAVGRVSKLSILCFSNFLWDKFSEEINVLIHFSTDCWPSPWLSCSWEVCLCECYLHCGDVLSREGIGSVADE